ALKNVDIGINDVNQKLANVLYKNTTRSRNNSFDFETTKKALVNYNIITLDFENSIESKILPKSHSQDNEESDNDTLIHIKYSDPVVTIGDGTSVLNNIPEFISVNSTISQRPSIDAYSEAEKLFSQLKNAKDEIDRILYSQNVYAVGPDFQNDYSIPCITCWVAKPLELSVMKQLSDLFDNKFDIVYNLVDAVDINNGCNDHDESSNETSNGNDNASNVNNSSKIKKNSEGNEKNVDSPKEGDGNDGDGHDGDSDDDDGHDGDNNDDDGHDGDIIKISSNGKVVTEDKKSQCFNITVHLWASINIDSEYKNKKTLEFKVYLKNCSVEKLLSDQSSLLNGFVCYYLDSLEVSVFPKKNSSKSKSNNEPPKLNANDESLESDDEIFESDDEIPMIMLKENHTPSKANNSINISKANQSDNSAQIDVGQSNKVSYRHAKVKNQSFTTTLNEWHMDDTYGSTNGVQWPYQFIGGDVFSAGDHRKSIRIDESHCGHWYISKDVGGFCITIIQVLGCNEKRNIFRRLTSKTPELIKQYPKLVHKLEITFNDIANFNSDFAILAEKLYNRPYLTLKKPIHIRKKNNAEFKGDLSAKK
ncbi:3514_t:CDS:2, partial [Racocetra persica]